MGKARAFAPRLWLTLVAVSLLLPACSGLPPSGAAAPTVPQETPPATATAEPADCEYASEVRTDADEGWVRGHDVQRALARAQAAVDRFSAHVVGSFVDASRRELVVVHDPGWGSGALQAAVSAALDEASAGREDAPLGFQLRPGCRTAAQLEEVRSGVAGLHEAALRPFAVGVDAATSQVVLQMDTSDEAFARLVRRRFDAALRIEHAEVSQFRGP